MKAYFAGSETLKWLDVLNRNNVENRFVSYYYVRNARDKTTATQQNYINSKLLIVDSGAHTFFSESDQTITASVHKKTTKTVETPDEYFEKYLVWLKQNINILSYFVELDIGELVGQKKVLEWRKKLIKHGLYDKCITVCHPAVTTYKTYLKELDESESKYVAIEGLRPGRKPIPYGPYVLAAYKKNVKIHGFALTNQSIVSKYPFYSVDSTSWLTPAKYGQVQYFQNGKLKTVKSNNPKHMVTKIKPQAKYYNQENTRVDRSYALLENSIQAMQKFEEYYTKLWEKRGIVWT